MHGIRGHVFRVSDTQRTRQPLGPGGAPHRHRLDSTDDLPKAVRRFVKGGDVAKAAVKLASYGREVEESPREVLHRGRDDRRSGV